MSKAEILKLLSRQADAWLSRSTTLNPLSWLIAILLAGIFTSLQINTPIWLTITLTIFTGLAVILYFCAYLFFMHTDPDALRTEKYSLRKMEIEKNFGDSTTGQIEKSPISGIIDVDVQKSKDETSG